jgi:hypothetical protein
MASGEVAAAPVGGSKAARQSLILAVVLAATFMTILHLWLCPDLPQDRPRAQRGERDRGAVHGDHAELAGQP